jgi:hypothetical protein
MPKGHKSCRQECNKTISLVRLAILSLCSAVSDWESKVSHHREESASKRSLEAKLSPFSRSAKDQVNHYFGDEFYDFGLLQLAEYRVPCPPNCMVYWRCWRTQTSNSRSQCICLSSSIGARILFIPATSESVEQLFSVSGRVVTTARARLCFRRVNELCCLH